MATAGTNWRLANSLATLRTQINTTYPNRNRASDGTIGDTAHSVTVSDHNPNAAGVVTAMDITHDPASGCNVQTLADNLAASRDARIKYLIFNDHIMVPSDHGWVWRFHYAGSHRSHLHVSVWGNYDDTTNWQISQKDDTMIPTRDLLNALFIAFYDRPASDAEANMFVGKISYNQLIPVLNDARGAGNERARLLYILEKGKVAISDKWEDQIHQQTKLASDAQTRALNAEKALADLQASQPKLDIISAATKPVEAPAAQEPIDTKNVNWLVRILINLFDKKQ